jgi:curved DNA-binding protein CbpA
VVPQPRNHYDNLQVARNAHDEVIEAAYRALVQKFHPDRNSSARATRVMRIVNAAYEVLSDSAKRQQHDEWIASTETRASAKASSAVSIRLVAAARTLVSNALQRSRRMAPAVVKRRVPIALLALVLALVLIQMKSPSTFLQSFPVPRNRIMCSTHPF